MFDLNWRWVAWNILEAGSSARILLVAGDLGRGGCRSWRGVEVEVVRKAPI